MMQKESANPSLYPRKTARYVVKRTLGARVVIDPTGNICFWCPCCRWCRTNADTLARVHVDRAKVLLLR